MDLHLNELDELADKLSKLSQLRENGDLTEDEFSAVKAKLLRSELHPVRLTPT